MNHGKSLTPKQEKVALEFVTKESLQTQPKRLREELQLCRQEPVPELHTLQAWLKHRRKKAKKEATAVALEQPASGHLNTALERTKLEDWLHPDEALLNRHTLQIQKIPAPRLEGDTLCVIFYCEAMRDTLRRYKDVELILAVDAKQGEMKSKEGIVDVNLIAKDKLRTTNFARVGKKTMPGTSLHISRIFSVERRHKCRR